MTVTTSRGKTFDVDWMGGPTSITGEVVLEYKDSRNFIDIIKDFDNVDYFHRESDNEGNMDFYGYTKLVGITRVYNAPANTVRLTFAKE